MAVNNFIPELWSARLLSQLEKELVYGALCNTDYEGDIAAAGDRVKITTIGPLTIDDYVPNVTVIAPEQLNDSQLWLDIDQSKFFAFAVDDVDARQAGGNLIAEGISLGGYGLKDAADQYIAGKYTEAGYISNLTAITALNVSAALLDLGEELTKNNIPHSGRWCVVPPWFTTKLVLAKMIIENATNTAFENGYVGRATGFDIYESNNVPTTNNGAEFKIMAGFGTKAISFAQQISKVEAYRRESAFGDAVKGLHLYGAKVVYPEALVVLDATKGNES